MIPVREWKRLNDAIERFNVAAQAYAIRETFSPDRAAAIANEHDKARNDIRSAAIDIYMAR